MILNKDMLKDAIMQRIEYEIEEDYSVSNISNVDELHDIALLAEINDVCIEDDATLCWEMEKIMKSKEGQELLDEINDIIDEEFQSYYLDPAFSSAADYWNYILG